MKKFFIYLSQLIISWVIFFIILTIISSIIKIDEYIVGAIFLGFVLLSTVIQCIRFFSKTLAVVRVNLNANTDTRDILTKLTDNSESASNKNKSNLYGLLSIFLFVITFFAAMPIFYFLKDIIKNPENIGWLLFVWPLTLALLFVFFVPLFLGIYLYKKSKGYATRPRDVSTPQQSPQSLL